MIRTVLLLALIVALSLTLISIVDVIIADIRKNRYFRSPEFRQIRERSRALINEHNAIAKYADEIRDLGTFDLGSSRSGRYAHLGAYTNTSRHNYRRDRNVSTYAPHVHNASLQVVKNASVEPIKYLIKYFDIGADTGTLADVQRVAQDIGRLEAAIANLQRREADLQSKISPPAFILRRFDDEFWRMVGVRLPHISVPYPKYTFQYTSAGGNSSQELNLVLDTTTLEAIAATLVERIRWTKSIAGQRALMTKRLRDWIKQRDGHACLQCGISVTAEPHLLLEVDHIVPVSRGGLSTPVNLQTLCWRCNRSKGAKLVG